MSSEVASPRRAAVADAGRVARLLHDFNEEFDTPSPGTAVLERRLAALLASGTTYSVLAGEPPVAVALVTLRTNVWHEGGVALLDELYVAPERRGRGIGSAVIAHVLETARHLGVGSVEINVDEGDTDALRFYAGHGFSVTEPDTGERAFYLFQDLDDHPGELSTTTSEP